MGESPPVPVLPVGDSASPEGVLYLNCPQCGLTLMPKARWLAIEHCPRCIARRSSAIKMLRTTSPIDPLSGGPWFSVGGQAVPGARAG